MSIMTFTDLSDQMRGYAVACSRRDRTVIFASAVVLALTVFTVLSFPRFFLIPVAGFAMVAVFVTATCHRWHRRHGVFCPHCGHSLVELGEKLEEISTGASIPDSLSCPHCREIVAKHDAA